MNQSATILNRNITRRARAALLGLAAVAMPASALGTVLYSTSFEEFTAGNPLSTSLVQTSDPTLVSPNSWFHVGESINNATVTSSLANSGAQSVAFTDNTRVMLAGPWSAPILDFEYSFLVEGPETFGDPIVDGIFNGLFTPLGPFRFALPDGQRRYWWPGSVNIESSDEDGDGVQETLSTSGFVPGSATFEVGEWSKINSIYNTVNQTLELLVDDRSLGTVPMANIQFDYGFDITEFPFLEFGTLNQPNHNFYIDDLSITSITAVPVPPTLGLFALGTAALGLGKRRTR